MQFTPTAAELRFLVLLLGLVLLSACGSDLDNGFGSAEEPTPIDPSELCNEPGASQCDGLDYQVCVEGRWFRQETCESPTPMCDPLLGCTECTPDARFCAGRDVYACDALGTTAELVETCDVGEECLLGQCYSACSLAESTESYLGCRFLAVATANILDPAFDDDFALVVTNPAELDAAEVVVMQGTSQVASQLVPPGETRAISLAFPEALQDFSASSVVPDVAYEVTTTVPVAAYQYNPLHFQQDVGKEVAHSYTNDASLLLPEHVLTGSYLISTWPTFGIGEFPGESQWSPGFVAVTATQDGTSVTITSSANTQSGDVAPLTDGEQATVTLHRGDVLQLFSESPVSSLQTNTCLLRGGEQASNGNNQSCLDRQLGDLSGTVIESSAPVAVFAGHVCTFMPFDRFACDHLEEMMFPLETWGLQAFMTAPQSPSQLGVAPTLYRVMSGGTANFIDFTPAVHDPVQLNSGEFIEFLSAADFLVQGTAPLYVTQTMLGEQALSTQSGDPALGSGIPVNQWRSEYDFLVPETYTSNWLNLVSQAGADIYLDGTQIEDWESVSETGHQVARIEVEPGSHHIESVGGEGFGITSYGYASYTSYLLPGGMNFFR